MDDDCYIDLAVLVVLEVFAMIAFILLLWLRWYIRSSGARKQKYDEEKACQKNRSESPRRSRQYIARLQYDQEQQAPLLSNQDQEHEIYDQQDRFDVLQQTEKHKSRICDLEDELRRQRDQNESLNGKLQRETQEKDEALKRFDVLQQTEEECKRRIRDLEDELKRESNQYKCLNEKLQKETEEKDDALKRLSALMSNRLRDGNPNVVDLSDQNRPLKVGEQFSELYDNQWTDAFTALQEQFQDKTERDFIELLLKIAEICYETCKQATEKEMTQLKHDVDSICASITHGESKLADDLMQRIKEERKLAAANKIPDDTKVIQLLKESFASRIAIDAECSGREPVFIYVQECLRLCHLIVNQDPPMMIESSPDPRNSDNFKAYQTRGEQIVYVVWPVLFLHEGGPMVSKGVAEFEK